MANRKTKHITKYTYRVYLNFSDEKKRQLVHGFNCSCKYVCVCLENLVDMARDFSEGFRSEVTAVIADYDTDDETGEKKEYLQRYRVYDGRKTKFRAYENYQDASKRLQYIGFNCKCKGINCNCFTSLLEQIEAYKGKGRILTPVIVDYKIDKETGEKIETHYTVTVIKGGGE